MHLPDPAPKRSSEQDRTAQKKGAGQSRQGPRQNSCCIGSKHELTTNNNTNPEEAWPIRSGPELDRWLDSTPIRAQHYWWRGGMWTERGRTRTNTLHCTSQPWLVGCLHSGGQPSRRARTMSRWRWPYHASMPWCLLGRQGARGRSWTWHLLLSRQGRHSLTTTTSTLNSERDNVLQLPICSSEDRSINQCISQSIRYMIT